MASDFAQRHVGDPPGRTRGILDRVDRLVASRFVGREREIANVLGRLELARSGRPSVLLVIGELGIGKTRLLTEALGHAPSAGLLVWGTAEEGRDGAPLFLFRQVLNAAVEVIGRDQLFALTPDQAQHLIPLLDLPEGASARPDPIHPNNERHRLFEAVATTLRDVATASGSLVVVLEDLQWADEASLLLLQHLGQRLSNAPLLILGSYRSTHVEANSRLLECLEELAPGGHLSSLELTRLDHAGVAQMLAELAPDPPRGIVDTVYSETEGNPLFVAELVHSLQEQGRLLDESGRWRVQLEVGEADLPPTLQLILRRRLRGASRDCRALLNAAAILGRSFKLPLLRKLSIMDEKPFVAALDEAEQLGFIEAEALEYRFRHEVFRQSCLAAISATQRQQMHLEVARALETTDLGDLRVHLAEVAIHYHLAGALAPTGKRIEFAEKAGVHAQEVFGFEEAIKMFDIALTELDGNLSSEGQEVASRMHARRAEALFSLGRWQDAITDFQYALKGQPPELQPDLHISLALCATWAADMPLARHHAEAAAKLAQELGADHLKPRLEAINAYFDTDGAELDRAIERFRAATAHGGARGGSLERRLLSQFPTTLYWTGQFEEAIEQAHAVSATSRERHDARELASVLPTLGLALAASGRYVEAEEALAEGRQLASDFSPADLVAVSKSAGFHVDTFDYEGARRFAEQSYRPARSLPAWPFSAVSSGIDLLFISIRTHELGEAERLLAEVPRQVESAQGRHGWLWRLRLAQAKAEMATAQAKWREALELSEIALQKAQQLRPKYEALALEARGKALAGLGQTREGIASLTQAARVARRIGDPALLLRADAALLGLHVEADVLTEAVETRDRILIHLPEEMRAGFEAAVQVERIDRIAGQSAARNEALPGGLTGRELDVLKLLAVGRTNQEIADALVISVRTAERHINHIYAKLEVHTRAQATAFALRQGLVA